MAATKRADDVFAVDAFLAEPKSLKGSLPEWTASERLKELQAVWLIADAVGVERAQLRFRVDRARRHFPSVSLLFRDRMVWRLDLVHADECKPNPPLAARRGLPPRVCGPHCHQWDDNREYLLTNPPKWSLPIRRALPSNVRRLPQALPWLAERLNLEMTAEQRGFDVPPKTDLFGL